MDSRSSRLARSGKRPGGASCAAIGIRPSLYIWAPEVAACVSVPHKSSCRAVKTRATIGSIVFLVAKARPSLRVDLIDRGCALDRGQRMLELWNKWYETLASVEALATVVVIVVVAAGVITLVEGRRRPTKH